MRVTTTLSLALFALCACSSDDSSQTTTVSDLLIGIAQQDCNEAFQCEATYPGDSFAEDYGVNTTDCVQDSTDPDDIETIESDIADGTIGYDEDAAYACVTGIVYSSCADYWDNGTELPDACDVVFQGTVPDGGLCDVDLDCAGALSTCDLTQFICVEETGVAKTTNRHAAASLLRRR